MDNNYNCYATGNGTWIYEGPAADPYQVDSNPVGNYEYSTTYKSDSEGEWTGYFGLNGAASDYVIYVKGYHNGKAIVNGLYPDGHAYTVGAGFCDATGIAAEAAAKGEKSAKNATKAAKAATFSDPFYWDTDYYNTDISGLKFLGQYNGQSPEAGLVVADAKSSCPITKWDAEGAALAVKDQVKYSGEFFFGVKNASENKKYQWKEAALTKTLDAAFGTKESTGASYIDTTADVDWYPTTADPMDALIEEENEMETLIAKAKAACTSDEWEMVIAKSNGMNQSEMAATFGFYDNSGIAKKLKAIAKKASKATGMAFVA